RALWPWLSPKHLLQEVVPRGPRWADAFGIEESVAPARPVAVRVGPHRDLVDAVAPHGGDCVTGYRIAERRERIETHHDLVVRHERTHHVIDSDHVVRA